MCVRTYIYVCAGMYACVCAARTRVRTKLRVCEGAYIGVCMCMRLHVRARVGACGCGRGCVHAYFRARV